MSAFIAGTDLLMIPGAKYKGALKAFHDLSEGRSDNEMVALLEARLRQPIETIKQVFMNRIQESLARLHETQGQLHHSVDTVVTTMTPTQLTQNERSRYFEILERLGYNKFNTGSPSNIIVP